MTTRKTYISKNPSARVRYHALAIQEEGKPTYGEVCVTGKMDLARKFDQLLIPFVIQEGTITYDVFNAYEPKKTVQVDLRRKKKGENLSDARKPFLEAILENITWNVKRIGTSGEYVEREETEDGKFVVRNFGQNRYSRNLYQRLSNPSVTGLRLRPLFVTITAEMVGKPDGYELGARQMQIIYTPMGQRR